MSEALRLADALEQQFPIGTAQYYLDGEAAAELRRLHALNAELVEALTEVLYFQSAKEVPSIYDWGRWRKVRDRAALAKVEKE